MQYNNFAVKGFLPFRRRQHRRVRRLRKTMAAVHPPPGNALQALWPWPTEAAAYGGKALIIDQQPFNFTLEPPQLPARSLRRLIHAFERYEALIFGRHTNMQQPSEQYRSMLVGAASEHLKPHIAASPLPKHLHAPALQQLKVHILNPNDEHLSLETDESYELIVNGSTDAAILSASSLYGALRGLETFSQLIVRQADQLLINSTHVTIRDMPRFPWRGVMLDSARHFPSIPTILAFLDAMSYNKLNVLHWHISDRQSFPLRLERTPRLALGAYSPSLTYSTRDVKLLVEYAAERGIRVVPEMDTPAHAASWRVGYPNATLRECDSLDPTRAATYALLDAVVAELATLFPDEQMHIGADEVDLDCWNRSEAVRAYLANRGMAPSEVSLKWLAGTHVTRVATILAKYGKQAVAWQEAMDRYGNSTHDPTPPPSGMPSTMIIEQWLQPQWNWANLSAIVGGGYIGRPDTWRGFRALTTEGYYLDNVQTINSWETVYAREPLTNKSCTYAADGREVDCSCTCPSGAWRDGECHCFDLRFDAALAPKVLGGEAALWSEFIDDASLSLRAFPRACAMAERLWSRMTLRDAAAARNRLLHQRCRMERRGVRVTPLGPGYC